MNESTEKLDRSIGVSGLALAIINIVVGSGIFVIPAIIAEGLGATAMLAYVACGILVLLIGLCFAELGSRTLVSGGMYSYIENSFGSYAGFLASSVYWIGGCVVADAAVANALVGFLRVFFPVLGQEAWRFVFIFIVFGGLMLVNVRSSRFGMRLVRFTAIGKLLPLVILVFIGVRLIDPANLRWEIEPTFNNIGKASLLLFFAFIGMEAPLSNGGEIKNPRRTVPLGILLGTGGVLLLYVSIQLITQGVLGAGITAHKAAPLAAVAGIAAGHTGSVIIAATSALSVLGMLAGEMFSIPRILFASARNGALPGPLAKVHPRFTTPHVAILLYGSIGFILAVSGSFQQLALLSSASVLLVYFGVMMATIQVKLKTKRIKAAGAVESEELKTFRMPGGPAIPAVAGLAIVWLLSNLEKKELAAVVLFIAILTVVYYINRLWKKKSKAITV